MAFITDEELAEKVKRREIAVRKRNRKKKRIRAVIVLLAVVLVLSLAFTKCSKSDYDDAESFEKYASDVLDSMDIMQDAGDTEEVIRYGSVKSSAVRYPKNISDKTDDCLKKQVEKYIERYKRDYSEYSDPDKDKLALFVSYDSAIPQKNITGVAFRKLVKQEKDSEMVTVSETVDAHNYITENGVELLPSQVFEPGYGKKISLRIASYLKDKYGDKLKSGYMKYVSDEDSLNNFLLTDDSVIFYYDAGTVLPEKEGTVSIEFLNNELDGIRKEKIRVRVIDPDKPMVAITFDDGPAAGTSRKILDCLEKNNAVATFFELGLCVENVSSSKEILQRQQDLGCETGSHSYSHVDFTKKSASVRKKEIEKTNKAIKERIGKEPSVFRPPYGAIGEKAAKDTGLPNILWSVDTMDWKSRKASSVIATVKKTSNLDGKVVLMHSIYDSTAEALEKIVPWLQKKGYQLVTVSEMIRYRYGDEPAAGKVYGYGYFNGK